MQPLGKNAKHAVKLVALGLAFFSSFVLEGCSSVSKATDDASWPSIAKVLDPDNIMTPEQRQKAVQDIQKDGTSPAAAGAKPAGQ